ncbi:MAG: hypothetical protein IJ575_02195, partial [Selenomonadaceae bacterium]|nr:hypothetical protein [Selenomonadaceae bacterium]
MGRFEVQDFSPSVRYIGDDVFATVGDASYMVDTEFSPRDKRHILVGRYCSIARELLLMIGENHDYRSVTTYPLREKRYLRH